MKLSVSADNVEAAAKYQSDCTLEDDVEEDIEGKFEESDAESRVQISTPSWHPGW